MIRNQWYAIMESGEVSQKDPVSIKRFGEKLVLWRDDQGRVCCIADKCCHRGASLGTGTIEEGQVACPFHGLQYDATGRVTVIPAQGKSAPVPSHFKVHAYPVQERHDIIWVWWGEEMKTYPDIFFFDDLKEGYSYGTYIDTWPVHYSRAIENQLDMMHLPFVHRTTIGRANRRLVNGPVVERQGDLIRFYVKNAQDDGITKPLKPEEITDLSGSTQLQFHFPNIWQNMVSDKMRIFAIFAPVDDENTRIYMRFYHNIIMFPPMRQLMNFLGKKLNGLVLGQDKRAVITQVPVATQLKMDENLVLADRPIVEYRRRRDELQKIASGQAQVDALAETA